MAGRGLVTPYASIDSSWTGLAGQGPTPSGRSMADNPERRLERAARRGSLAATKALVDLKQNRLAQDFTLERDSRQFEATKQLRGLDQAFTEKMRGDDRQFQQDQSDQSRDDMVKREERHNQRNDFEWQRQREAEAQDRAMGGIDSAFMLRDAEGQFGVPMVRDKGGNVRPMGGAMPTPKLTTPPTPAEIAKRISDDLAKGVVTSWDGKKWTSTALRPQAADPGSTTTTYDADGGVVSKSERVPKGKTATGGTGYF